MQIKPMSRQITMCNRTFLLIPILACGLALVSLPAHAVLILPDIDDDSGTLAHVMVTAEATPAPAALTHVTYSFVVAPKDSNDQIVAIEGHFSTESTGTTMRQVDPDPGPGVQPTVFNNSNFAFVLVGENTNGLGDSQFDFNDDDLQVTDPMETNMSLDAAFAGITPITTSMPMSIAHIVLPSGEVATAILKLTVREIGQGGEGVNAIFSEFTFGGAVAVPEASALAIWSLLGAGAVAAAWVTKRRNRRIDSGNNPE